MVHEYLQSTFITLLGGSTTPTTSDPSHGNTTDTSSHHGSGHAVGVFGSLGTLSPFTGTLSLLIIIYAVYLVESLFHELHRYSDDTPFQDMIAGLEKELMIVGCMAFIFKIIISNNHFLSTEWLHALEYADTVVPFVSFCFCGIGLFLILTSIVSCKAWSRAYHLTPEEILVDYYQSKKSDRCIMKLIKSMQISTELEFKVFHEIFCTQHHIKRFSIAFDAYVERVFERYLVETITIEPTDWAIICIFALLNWGRKELDWNYHGECDYHDTACADHADLVLFTVAGCVMLAATVILALWSRYYERELLMTVGVNTVDDCFKYLHSCDKTIHEPKRGKVFDVGDIKSALTAVRHKGSSHHSSGNIVIKSLVFVVIGIGQFLFYIVYEIMTGFLWLCRRRKNDSDFKDVELGDSISSRRKGGSFSRNSGGQDAHVGLMPICEDGGSLKESAAAPPPKLNKQVSLRSQQFRMRSSGSSFRGGGKGRESISSLPTLASSNRVVPVTLPLSKTEEIENSLASSSPPTSAATPSAIGFSLNPNANNFSPLARKVPGEEDDKTSQRSNHFAAMKTEKLPAIQRLESNSNDSPVSRTNSGAASSSGRQRSYSVASSSPVTDGGFTRKISGQTLFRTVSGTIVNRNESNHEPSPQLSSWKAGVAPGALGAGAEAIRSSRDSNDEGSSFGSLQNSGRAPTGGLVDWSNKSKIKLGTGGPRTSNKVATFAETGAHISRKLSMIPASFHLPAQQFFRGIQGNETKKELVPEDNELGAAIRDAFLHRPEKNGDESLSEIKTESRDALARMFLFEWPELYFQTIMFQVMIVSFYLALWVTNFSVTAVGSPDNKAWALYSFLPGLLSALLYMYIVKCAALMKGMIYLDQEALSQVIEETEASKALGEEVRRSILQKLPKLSDPETELKVLFQQISSEGSASLTRTEFQMLLNSMDIYFSRKKWAMIFKEVDHNFDDEISLEELFLFIFPDHDMALKAEKKRLKIIAERVKHVNAYIRKHNTGEAQVDITLRQLMGSDEEIIRKMRRTSIMGASDKVKVNSGGKPSPAGSVKDAQAALAATLIASMPPIAQLDKESSSSSEEDRDKPSETMVVVSARRFNTISPQRSGSSAGGTSAGSGLVTPAVSREESGATASALSAAGKLSFSQISSALSALESDPSNINCGTSGDSAQGSPSLVPITVSAHSVPRLNLSLKNSQSIVTSAPAAPAKTASGPETSLTPPSDPQTPSIIPTGASPTSLPLKAATGAAITLSSRPGKLLDSGRSVSTSMLGHGVVVPAESGPKREGQYSTAWQDDSTVQALDELGKFKESTNIQVTSWMASIDEKLQEQNRILMESLQQRDRVRPHTASPKSTGKRGSPKSLISPPVKETLLDC